MSLHLLHQIWRDRQTASIRLLKTKQFWDWNHSRRLLVFTPDHGRRKPWAIRIVIRSLPDRLIGFGGMLLVLRPATCGCVFVKIRRCAKFSLAWDLGNEGEVRCRNHSKTNINAVKLRFWNIGSNIASIRPISVLSSISDIRCTCSSSLEMVSQIFCISSCTSFYVWQLEPCALIPTRVPNFSNEGRLWPWLDWRE